MRHLYYTIHILLRGRGNNFIKLMSLTLGLLIGILLFSQIAYELNYENFYKEPERVVMLRMHSVRNGVPGKGYDTDVFRPAANDLWEALPDLIESASISISFGSPELYIGDERLEKMNVMFADTLFFQTIGLEVLRGNPADLATPGSAFLSQTKARELFGDGNPIGKTFSMDRRTDVTVRGIYRDVPGNTVYFHNVVISLPTVEELYYGRGTWKNNDIYNVLFRLKSVKDVAKMNRRVQKAVENYTETENDDGSVTEYNVLPLPDIYLSRSENVRRLVILAVLGFSIFFVSIMNYVLASVASFSRRAKGVGVHKCCGANGARILGMFLWETGLLVMVSVVLCLLLLYLFSDAIEDMLSVRLQELFTWQTLWVPVLTVLLLFFMAGILPGRMFARIPVTQVFRHYTDSKRSWKRGLLFMQFIGVAFILGMLLTTIWQYHTLMNRSVGFRTERLVTGNLQGEVDVQTVEDAIRRQPYTESVSRSLQGLLQHYNTIRIKSENGNPGCSFHWQFVTKEFPRQVGMALLKGSFPQHAGEAVISHTMMKNMKWHDNAIGQKLPVRRKEGDVTVVGVIEDIRNMGFFWSPTNTAFILHDGYPWRTFHVRLKEPVEENVARLNAFIKESYPQAAMEFTSYGSIRRHNNSDVYRFRNTVWVTSTCILLIVLIGLIGYVNDETQRRSKEIAIRKVNGAEVAAILQLLSADILKVAVGAVIIGIAFAWYVSGLWMEQFSDSTLLSPVWFVLLGVGLLGLIVLVVVLKSWRIANENPVKSIKSE